MKANEIKLQLEQLPYKMAHSLEINIRNLVSRGQRTGEKKKYKKKPKPPEAEELKKIKKKRNKKKGKKAQPNRPSAPGEPPAKQTGNLINNTNLKTVQGSNKYEWFVQINAPYALHLDLGTKKMKPRPFIRPSIKKTRETFGKIGKT